MYLNTKWYKDKFASMEIFSTLIIAMITELYTYVCQNSQYVIVKRLDFTAYHLYLNKFD